MFTAQSNDEISHRTFRLILVFATAVVAVTTPHFTLFVNLIGSVACTMLGTATSHFPPPDFFRLVLPRVYQSARCRTLWVILMHVELTGCGCARSLLSPCHVFPTRLCVLSCICRTSLKHTPTQTHTRTAFVLPTIFYLRLVDNPTTMLYVKSAAIVIFRRLGWRHMPCGDAQ